MNQDDSQFQRILWRDSTGTIKTYCLTTVTFGTASAPYTAIRVLHQLAQDEKQNYPLASNVILNDMYVDDILSGGDNLEHTLEVREQLISTLKSAGMELRKWSANTSSLLRGIPVEHQSCNPDCILNEKSTVKTLGLVWHPQNDMLSFQMKNKLDHKCTKRAVLSVIARLYDPLGLISPITVAAKIILKNIWMIKIQRSNGSISSLEWVEELPDSLRAQWQLFISDFSEVKNIAIPRWLGTQPHLQSLSLHAFCDGSQPAFAAAIYLRIENSNEQVDIKLIAAKNRIAPNKTLTIPRIELCGAVLAAFIKSA